jgi:ABC-type multidrug transport system ATPase subunit
MLTIDNLTKSFGDVKAMQGITLDLKPGLFGLLGPNGAGKSTLMRTLATLQKPDAGSVALNGVDIVANPDAMRSTLGYLPQDFGVYPRMSAKALLDHIAVLKGIGPKSVRSEQIISLLKNVNLLKHSSANVSTYSGGMRQRFGVAQALLGDPDVLIVDEPTAGLDPFERQRFLDLLSEAGEEKIIILSTHIVEDVRDLCTDMAIMGEGRIVVRGEPEALVQSVAGRIWRKIMDKDDAEALTQRPDFLNKRRKLGRTEVTLLGLDFTDEPPLPGFEKADVGLEDAYFAYLNGHLSGGEVSHAA